MLRKAECPVWAAYEAFLFLLIPKQDSSRASCDLRETDTSKHLWTLSERKVRQLVQQLSLGNPSTESFQWVLWWKLIVWSRVIILLQCWGKRSGPNSCFVHPLQDLGCTINFCLLVSHPLSPFYIMKTSGRRSVNVTRFLNIFVNMYKILFATWNMFATRETFWNGSSCYLCQSLIINILL